MLFVNYKINAPRQEIFPILEDSSLVVDAEKYDTSRGKPKMHIKKKKNEVLKIKCELTERPTKDNGFLEGTYFLGRFSERNGVSKIRGVIVTAPIYHSIILSFLVYFIIQCIIVGGISPIPIILVIFDVFMFKDEFRKQGIIKRYILRALKIVYANMTTGVKKQ